MLSWHRWFLFFWPCQADCRISVPWLGIEPGPQQWKPRILTTRPPGNSQHRGFMFGVGSLSNWSQTKARLGEHHLPTRHLKLNMSKSTHLISSTKSATPKATLALLLFLKYSRHAPPQGLCTGYSSPPGTLFRKIFARPTLTSFRFLLNCYLLHEA